MNLALVVNLTVGNSGFILCLTDLLNSNIGAIFELYFVGR
jgi:hypothetical protein